MRIYLDNIIFQIQRVGGISRYWYELIRRMKETGLDCQFIEGGSARCNCYRGSMSLERKETVPCIFPPRIERYIPCLHRIPHGSIFHSSYYRVAMQAGVKHVVTVHDFIYEHFRTGLPQKIHSWQKKLAVERADGIICISESTKKDLLEFYPHVQNRIIRVIYNGVSDEFRRLPDPDLPARFHDLRAKRCVLFVGKRDQHKSFDFAVSVVGRLDGYHLLLAGGDRLGEQERRRLDEELKGRYSHLVDLSEQDLNALYNLSFCLLYPSAYEGFGIPVLEAMRAGCPVIALDTSSIPEVAGDAGILLPALDPELAVHSIRHLEQGRFREHQIALGIQRAKSFSWDRTFRETLDLYREVEEAPAR